MEKEKENLKEDFSNKIEFKKINYNYKTNVQAIKFYNFIFNDKHIRKVFYRN